MTRSWAVRPVANPVPRQGAAAHEPGGGTAGPPQLRADLLPLPPGAVPNYTFGPTGANPLTGQQWEMTLDELQHQVEEGGDFNHVLYNYAFMLTIDPVSGGKAVLNYCFMHPVSTASMHPHIHAQNCQGFATIYRALTNTCKTRVGRLGSGHAVNVAASRA